MNGYDLSYTTTAKEMAKHGSIPFRLSANKTCSIKRSSLEPKWKLDKIPRMVVVKLLKNCSVNSKNVGKSCNLTVYSVGWTMLMNNREMQGV